MTFAAQDVGTTSAAQPLTLRNSGSGALILSNVATTAEFSETNTCGGSLAVGASCTVNLTFAPSGMGTRTGTLTITDDAPDSPQVVPLSGVGGTGQIALSPANLAFRDTILGTVATQSLSLTNSGATAITISDVSAFGDFSQTNTCGSSLAAAAACSITVKFAPTAVGSRVGTIVINDSAPGSPHSAALTGAGLAQTRSVYLPQPTVTFPSQSVGTTSRPVTTQFTFTGLGSLTIAGITTSGDFAQTNACGSMLAPNAVCTINVTFTPKAAGTRTGTVTITDDAIGGVQSIALIGTGTDPGSASGPIVALSPGNLTFANQTVGSASPLQVVTLTNAGGAPLGIGGISTNDDFAENNTCGNSLVPSASCTIRVAFTPGSTGAHVGLLTITDTAPGSPHSVPLTGKAAAGSAAGPAVALSSTGLSFGAQHVNVSSSPQTVSVTNNSPAVVAISTISVEGDFSEADTCGGSIAAGATCTVTVVFMPSAVGTRGGKITINDDAPNSPQAIALSGTGVLGQIALSPASLTFSSQSVDTTSDAQTVSITNNGGAPATIVSVSATGDFAETNTCTDPLAASGGSCTVSVTFAPTSAGTRTGTLSIVDDAPGSPHSIVLDGTGTSR